LSDTISHLGLVFNHLDGIKLKPNGLPAATLLLDTRDPTFLFTFHALGLQCRFDAHLDSFDNSL
jgi:hypothetical protein